MRPAATEHTAGRRPRSALMMLYRSSGRMYSSGGAPTRELGRCSDWLHGLEPSPSV